jgi:hypothetical protein
MDIVKTANLALAFLLELVALAAYGYWGFRTGSSLLVKILLGLGAPVLVALFWGAFVAPKALVTTSPWIRHLLAMGVFALAALALYAVGKPSWAIIFLAVAVINRVLLIAWKQ